MLFISTNFQKIVIKELVRDLAQDGLILKNPKIELQVVSGKTNPQNPDACSCFDQRAQFGF